MCLRRKRKSKIPFSNKLKKKGGQYSWLEMTLHSGIGRVQLQRLPARRQHAFDVLRVARFFKNFHHA